jgi:hypothetical protein
MRAPRQQRLASSGGRLGHTQTMRLRPPQSSARRITGKYLCRRVPHLPPVSARAVASPSAQVPLQQSHAPTSASGHPQQQQPAKPASSMPAAAAAAATPVALTVEGCTLQHGEQLRLAGSSKDLGRWSFTAAPQLAAASNTNGTASWAAELSLAPGRHQCKLVVVRPNGSLHWEGGRHRTLVIPRLPVPAASQGPAGAAPARLQVTCRFGETASTALTRAPKKVKVRWLLGWGAYEPTVLVRPLC